MNKSDLDPTTSVDYNQPQLYRVESGDNLIGQASVVSIMN
jgi:hypothetical protein